MSSNVVEMAIGRDRFAVLADGNIAGEVYRSGNSWTASPYLASGKIGKQTLASKSAAVIAVLSADGAL
jgi:hypothetical protein